MSTTPAIFLDRDDTIIANNRVTAHTPHPGDLLDPALVEFLPGAAEGLQILAATKLPLVIVTNQGGIAQGFGTHADVEAVNDRLRELAGAIGVHFAGVYYSPNREIKGDRVGPHGPDHRYTTAHPWRKPAPGMLLAAAEDLGLDLPHSWMIGDAARDIEAGLHAGLARARCIQIGVDAADLLEAAQRVMSVHSQL
jgi:D-glycero-D-manno-heptose 1,7-bisphosphate phosphatase